MADSSLTRWHDGGYRTWIKSARSSTIIASKSSLTCAQHPTQSCANFFLCFFCCNWWFPCLCAWSQTNPFQF
jgi:hypothetical protein